MNQTLKTIETLRERERERATLLNNGNDVANDLRVVHKNVGEASSFPQETGVCAIHRGENGITLIALIVTIIVLLILAMTTVSLVLRENLIEKAQLAKDEYEKAAQTESDQLDKLENAIDNIIPPPPPPPEEDILAYNTPYYFAGQSEYMVMTFNENENGNGEVTITINGSTTKADYQMEENNKINIGYFNMDNTEIDSIEITPIKAENNYILIGSVTGLVAEQTVEIKNLFLATSTEDLLYFNGESYYNIENDEYIRLYADRFRFEDSEQYGWAAIVPPVCYGKTLYLYGAEEEYTVVIEGEETEPIITQIKAKAADGTEIIYDKVE